MTSFWWKAAATAGALAAATAGRAQASPSRQGDSRGDAAPDVRTGHGAHLR
jgi:hypothetical protein